jgi:hypothetical protein
MQDFCGRYVIYGAGDMTEKGRKAVADWLRMAARDLERDGESYNRRFVGKYMVAPPDKRGK